MCRLARAEAELAYRSIMSFAICFVVRYFLASRQTVIQLRGKSK